MGWIWPAGLEFDIWRLLVILICKLKVKYGVVIQLVSESLLSVLWKSWYKLQ